MKRLACIVLHLMLVALFCPRARAQVDERGDERPTAEALFAAGREALRRGDYRSAYTKFAESNRLDPAVGTVLNLAICEEHLGRLASAWQRYQEVIHALGPGDERLPVARARAVAIDARVPRLTIRLSPAAPAETQISRGASALTSASFDVPLPLDPGTHEIVAISKGRSSRRYVVALDEGARKELIVEPGPPAPEPAPKRAPPDSTAIAATASRDGPNLQRTSGFIIGGAGIAALIASAVTGVLVVDRKQTVDRECESGLCSDAGLQASESGRTLASLSTIAFVVGLVSVGSGTYLVLSSGSSAGAQAGSPAPKILGIRRSF